MKWRAAAIAVVAFLGMIDTFYLSAKRGSGPVPCTLTGGCNDVLNSSYSEVAGIPLSWIGLAYYVVIFSCAAFAWFGTGEILRWIFWPALAALAISLGLVAIQAFVLQAFCEYCLASAGFVTAILLLSPWPRRGHPA